MKSLIETTLGYLRPFRPSGRVRRFVDSSRKITFG